MQALIEDKLPRGMPGRKSFKYIPQEMKVFKKKEALKLR